MPLVLSLFFFFKITNFAVTGLDTTLSALASLLHVKLPTDTSHGWETTLQHALSLPVEGQGVTVLQLPWSCGGRAGRGEVISCYGSLSSGENVSFAS